MCVWVWVWVWVWVCVFEFVVDLLDAYVCTLARLLTYQHARTRTHRHPHAHISAHTWHLARFVPAPHGVVGIVTIRVLR